MRIVGRGRAPDPPLRGRPASSSSWPTSRGWSRTRRPPPSARRFLREQLAGRRARGGARRPRTPCCRVRRVGRAGVALGSRLAAELYGCQILATDVEDHPDNVTRFVWLAPAASAARAGPGAKTSIVFWGGGDESPGWLVDVLGELAEREREPDQDRVAPAAHRARPLHVLRGPRGRGRRRARVGEALEALCAGTSRSCAYSGRTSAAGALAKLPAHRGSARRSRVLRDRGG